MNEQQLQLISDSLSFDNDESEAKVYGLAKVDNQLINSKITSGPDIYDLIDNLSSGNKDELKGFDYLALITWGWAAPLNSDGEVSMPPSQDPKKRRVKLTISVDVKEKEIASIMQFQDDKDNLVFDYNSATGPLANAVSEIIS